MSELKVEQVFKKFNSLALTSNDNKTKPKRKNSEKRKEKSRYAARARRSQESEIFNQMGDELPISEKAVSLMDKSSIVRLGINFIKIRHLIDTIKSNSSNDTEDGLAILLNDFCAIKALNGIIVVLSKEGDMVYLSENVDKYLGLSQIDLMGQSIYDYSHPCDHKDIKDLLSLKNCNQNEILNANYSRIPCSTFIRMKCTLTNKGRNLNLKSAPYKIIHFTGHIVNIDYMDVKSNNGVTGVTQLSQSPRYCLFTIGELIDHPHTIEKPLSESVFVSRHSLDMKYLHVDDRIRKILGYCQKDLSGKSLYNFFHALDLPRLENFFKTLFAKGQCESGYYRYLAKFGGYAWLLTEATVITDSPTSEPQCVICINHVISAIENKSEITSEEQEIKLNDVEEIANEINIITENQSIQQTQSIQPIQPLQPIQAINPNPAPKPPITIISSTQSVFAPKTADMESGFLVFTDDDANDMTILADAEDLTHLAPEAGDVSVPLDVPSMFNVDLNDMNFFDDLVSSLNGYNMNNFTDEDKCMKMNDENMNFNSPNDNQDLRTDDFFKAKDESETLIGKMDDSYMLKCVVQNIIKNPNILKDINLNENIAPNSPSSDDLFLNSLSQELSSHSPSSDSSDASDLYSPANRRSPSMNTPSPVLSQSSNYYCESPTYEAVSKLNISDTEKLSDDIDLRTAYIPDNEDFSLLNEELQLYSNDLIDIDLPTNKQINFETTTTTKPALSDDKLYNNGQNCNYLAMLLQTEMPFKSKKLNNHINSGSKYDISRQKIINNYNMLNNTMSQFNASVNGNPLEFNGTANIMDTNPNGVSSNMRTNERVVCNQSNNGFLSPLKCNYITNTQNMIYPNKNKPNTESNSTLLTNGYKRPHSAEPPDLIYMNNSDGLIHNCRLPKVQTKNQQNKRRKADDTLFKNKGSSVLMNLLVNGEDVTNGYSKYSSIERVPKSYNITNNPCIYQKYSNSKKCTKNTMHFEEKDRR